MQMETNSATMSRKRISTHQNKYPDTVTMAPFYIVLEVTDSGYTLYPTPYKSLPLALAAIKSKWIALLEADARVNDTSAEVLWNETVAAAEFQNGVVSLYIEKGNNFEIHQMTLP